MSSLYERLWFFRLRHDSPLGCAATVHCGQITVACNPGHDMFALHRVDVDGVDVVIARGGATVSGSADSPNARGYYVCTESGAQRECTGMLGVQEVDGSCGGGGGGGGGGGVGRPGHPCGGRACPM